MIPEKPSRKKSSSIVFSIAMILVAGIMTAGFFISREGQTEQFGSGIESSIAINQTGYLPQADKFGILADAQTGFLEWQLINTSTSEILCSGQTSDVIEDSASRQTIVIADFSDCDTPGDYVLQINDQSSPSFFISPDIYEQLPIDALRYYYLNRSGIELEAPFAGEYARPAGHLSDNDVTCEGCAYTLDVSGGWYDAGDYNKYIVSAGISVWTLLNAYELMPDVYPDNSINIPESDNGIPDILDEARWELEFMMKMQIPPGYPDAGLVHHMIRTIEPGAIGVLPPDWYDNDNDFAQSNIGRYLAPPTTGSTYNLAAVAAQCSRIWRNIDPQFSLKCLAAAKTAFDAAQANPLRFPEDIYYTDESLEDERFWAATELYITTDNTSYLNIMEETPRYLRNFTRPGDNSPMGWRTTGTQGVLSLLVNEDVQLDSRERLHRQLIRVARSYRDRIADSPYRISIHEYNWGSNSEILNNALFLSYAHHFTGDDDFLQAALESLDYLLGRNALQFSYISGYGEHSVQHPHHAFWANEGRFPPPPPGVVVGGANQDYEDPAAREAIPAGVGPARNYVDIVGSWSTNEVAINYNAPLAWVAAYIRQVTQN